MSERLLLLAHAATPAQRCLRFPGDDGIEPLAPGVAARARGRLGSFAVAWRGPERRAAETASSLGVPAAPHSELRAWSMGRWAGQPVAVIAEHEPAAFDAWRTDPDAVPHDGESLNELLRRAGDWLEQYEAADASRTLVVADPAVIRAALVRALDAGVPTFWRVDVRPMSLTVIQRRNGEWRVRAMGVVLAG